MTSNLGGWEGAATFKAVPNGSVGTASRSEDSGYGKPKAT